MIEPLINHTERHSAAWMKVKQYLDDRLAALRESNDQDKDERKTSFIRGQIAEVKALRALADEAPAVSD